MCSSRFLGYRQRSACERAKLHHHTPAFEKAHAILFVRVERDLKGIIEHFFVTGRNFARFQAPLRRPREASSLRR